MPVHIGEWLLPTLGVLCVEALTCSPSCLKHITVLSGTCYKAHSTWYQSVNVLQENFLPWFAQQGYPCFAVSLRGHGRSSDECKSCPDKYAQSMEDIAHVVASLPEPPVLVAHSMSGFFAQRYDLGLLVAFSR